MSSLYNPDAAALLVQPWDEAFRTQRDLGLRVPINYLTTSAASLRAVCFAFNQYGDRAFQKCFSNLLATGFRRFLVDVYWDSGRSVWSLCPVEVPPSDSNSQNLRASSTINSVSEPSITGRAVRVTSEDVYPTSLPAQRGIDARPRQDDPVTESSSASSDTISVEISVSSESKAASSSTTSLAVSPSNTAAPTENGQPSLQIEDYNCTSTMTLEYLTGIFEDFLDHTSTTTEASLTFLTLNIHAAASNSAPNAPAQQPRPEQLPVPGHLVSNIIKGNLSDELYTPSRLRNERSNLNRSWYDVQWDNRPAEGYYQTSKDSSNHLFTQEGWPTESYMEFQELYRLIASFGSIDPQMADYDMSADLDTIFAPGTIYSVHNISLDAAGDITSGCLFSPSDITVTASTNSSWATTPVLNLDLGADPNTTTPIPAITNVTSCGLSPFLNTTLSNVTADQNPAPYLAFTYSTLWSWAPGEPLNTTDESSVSTKDRCAAIFMTPYPGRWRTIDCTRRHRIACQSPQNPYQWTLSTAPATPFTATCPQGYTFSAPHTSLENAHLLSAIQTHPSTASSSPDEPVFVNLNSLDVPNCWVLGINGTCPYTPPTDTNRTQVVVVPTVAAVIVFLMAALTFFVKCAANRREDKRGRRRRNVGGWEYEGVPS